MNCNICPRQCNIDRSIKQGFCASNDTLRVARASLHMWEEPCISGDNGSGTVFFSGCNLRCIFCQNMEISRGMSGRDISAERLVQIFFELKEKGANNINLVTPTHFSDQIKKAIIMAKDDGFDLPIVYNSSGYESVEVLKNLDGLIDVYLPDCKYYDEDLAMRFSSSPNYHKIAMKAIAEMLRQTKKCSFDDKGIIKSGVIVRHMVLPGHTNDSIRVIDSLYETFKDDIYISIMSQYTPVKMIREYPELNRRLTKREYKKVTDHALMIGITNGFIQDGEVALESFIPAFDCQGV
ncbi:MAG: radical SAM protein [Lachnospiraceae bacterium]|nr:radical SAM protein [Lachnospiraceae bacterium]